LERRGEVRRMVYGVRKRVGEKKEEEEGRGSGVKISSTY